MAKVASGITTLAAKSLKVEAGKQYARIYDGAGLFLRCAKRGVKVWRFRFKNDEGKERWLTLGEFPAMTVKDARQAASEYHNKVVQGIDPKLEQERQRIETQERGTFHEAALRWLEHVGNGWTARTCTIAKTWLVVDVKPVIGHLPIDEVTAPDLLLLLRKVDNAGHGYKVRRLHNYLKRIFSYAISNGLAKGNPASDLVLHDLFTTPTRINRPAFTEPKDVGALMRMIHGYEGSPVTRNAMELLALVFTRPGELAAMRWEEIDLDRKQWRYFVTKTKVDHIVPLSRQALAVLEEMRPLTGRWDFVFPCERSKKRFMSNNTINAALRYMGIDTKTQHTAHGFRAMARTLLAERGWSKEYLERQLCHKQADDTIAAYAREKHLPERTEMMQAWADYLDQLRVGAEVIPINRAA